MRSEGGELMGRLKSEIMFNRAMLWMVMGALTESATLKIGFLVITVWTVVRSAMAYLEDE